MGAKDVATASAEPFNLWHEVENVACCHFCEVSMYLGAVFAL